MFSIVKEVDDFLVIEKPVGLVVNRSETVVEQTLQDYLEEAFNSWSDKSTEFGQRSGIVHRLDKETSGLLLVAKTPEAFDTLKDLFKNRHITKKYIAVVHGHIEEDTLEINLPIIRNPLSRTKFAVSKDGKEAVTSIEVVKTFSIESNKFCLVNAYPATGRTHQIRVHLTAINHPVVGDTVYSGKNMQKIGIQYFGRLMLHALSLEFEYKSQSYHFESKLPSEFSKIHKY